ncbi:uncharacterized protein SAPINGB_P000757 [Magnusiomyces paraingens]|uniref:Pseudouridine synthase I TruA alpha/beta domain-containing protein n=1 Tax=Magnusiomyces paraingens TaxID=2606893 RepID=A0A5E8B2L9_9ASCO|nr:uncharacterized protein SAPINGB_P000757 [Saprochaete ingens]VVT45459.1 unnamed protein product [Saprochaete ingens]
MSSFYESWSKDQLIARIQQLEVANNLAGPPQSVSIPAIQTPNSKDTNEVIEATVTKKKKSFDYSKFSTRRIAIRFAYLGWNYNGLAVQINTDVPTVEGHILAALHKTKLIPSIDPNDCEFSRCGRTDKGVSALRQVISLRVRSLLTPEQQTDSANDNKEIDYLHILNQLLPDDIRLYEICLQPPEGFDARFSCLYRHYKYFFHNNNKLNLSKMLAAAKSFEGVHDFRNFCKVDGSKQISNFKREILSASIVKVSQCDDDNSLYCFDLKGTAFLWHQVRSMVAILFLVGQELEAPEVIQTLLDVENTPRRPAYEMAADIPLVLYDCGFPEMPWKSFKNEDSLQRLQDRLYFMWHSTWMKLTMASVMREMIQNSAHPSYGAPSNHESHRIVVNLGDGKGKNLTKYVLLSKRETLEPPEVVNERWLRRKADKNKTE